MAFFESELNKIFGKSQVIKDARFVGRACIGRLGETTNIKLEFVTLGTHQKYEGIKANVFNRNEGVIDSSVFRFADIFGKKPMTSNPAKTVDPHVWVYNEKTEWYGFKPNPHDYAVIAAEINSYLEVFLEPDQPREAVKTADKTGHTSVKDAISRGRENTKISRAGTGAKPPKNKNGQEM